MAETIGQQQIPEVSEEVIDLKQIIRILKRRWAVIVGSPLLLFIFALGYLRAAPRIYEAVSIVRVQQEISPIALTGLPMSPTRQSQQIDLKTVERLVATRLTAQEAVRILKVKNSKVMERLMGVNLGANDALLIGKDRKGSPINPEQLAIEAVMKSVRTKALEPDLVEIRIRNTDPELASLIANGVAEAMVQRFTREAQRDATQERQYIERSLKTLEQQLKDLEAKIANEKKRLGIVDIPKETETLITTLRNYELEWHNAQAQREAATMEVDRLRMQIEKEQPVVSVDVLKEDPLFKQMRDQLVALELERARLLASFTPEHPDVQQVEERINALKQSITKHARQLVKEREVAPNPAYQLLYQQLITAEANKFAAEARLQALDKFLPELRRRLEELPENQRRLGSLLRKAQATEQVYTNLLLRLEEARIREVTKTGNLVIADLASTPQEPISPRPLLTLSLSFALGLMLGVATAFVLEGLNETVTSSEEVQDRLGIPVLASIPKTRPELTHQYILDLMASRRSAAESVRGLRANLKFLSRERPIKVLLVTSTAPGEGKTFLSTSLAIAWAQSGHKTILVDFDLRRPQVHECLGLSNDKGLSNLLVGTASLDEVLQKTPLKNLKTITSGPLPPNPAELLDSEQIDQILKDLRERADIVVLDTPPILTVSDTSLLVPYSDGVIAVVVLGQTLKPMLKKLKEQVAIAQGRLIGAVINKVTTAHGGYYRYYYRYYSRYYGEAE
ncbi:MAG: polysaccharide biosynthesis tyrosine autokinase [Armatimonadetes bacterium]|nr:polysaccharide biosynthesis tyrosine autokinase [Armatimonadota bacterium]MDW8027868.1 polysaccharide biosynthesis tyrosine autokinase [Armatimonadota bacterium]